MCKTNIYHLKKHVNDYYFIVSPHDINDERSKLSDMRNIEVLKFVGFLEDAIINLEDLCIEIENSDENVEILMFEPPKNRVSYGFTQIDINDNICASISNIINIYKCICEFATTLLEIDDKMSITSRCIIQDFKDIQKKYENITLTCASLR